MAALLLGLVASAACLSSVASDARASVARDARLPLAATTSGDPASASALAPRTATMSAALLPEPGAWMMSTLGLLGLEWMARRKRVA